MEFPILTFVIFFPLAGAIILALLKAENAGAIKLLALTFSTVEFIGSLYLFFKFDPDTHLMQFVQKSEWIGELGINYYLGIDGISLFLVLITTFLAPICILASWTAIQRSTRGFFASLLLLEAGMLGVFCALDMFLFFVFWEAMLLPMYFIIGIWGHERRIYAAMKFVLFTMAGSALMLVAILALYFANHTATGQYTFDLLSLYATPLSKNAQYWLFLAFALAFAIKVPLFPLHTWLPDAHVEAPTAGSVILAGVLLKMGTYGFIRFCLPLFPEASFYFTPLICVLSLIGIIYGALVAMMQKDLKKLVAYSSVSHLGFVTLGIFAFTPEGMSGGILQMINHGLSTGALFLIVGMIYNRRHTRLISEFGGLSRQMPIFAAFFLIFTLSSIGLPGLNGFVGEFLILLGTFVSANDGAIVYAVIATSGVIFAAVYMLWMFQRVMLGGITKDENRRLKDVNIREIFVLAPIVLFIIFIGVYPRPFLSKMERSVEHVLYQVRIEKSAYADYRDPIKDTVSSIGSK